MPKTFWKVGVLSVAAILVVAGEAAAQRQSGIQRTPDGAARVLVSKDVGGQRYAITLNVAEGTVTGNVFSTDGSAPQFISCAPTGSIGSNAFDCRVAPTCDPNASRQSGIQRAFDSSAVLVSKDVGDDRFAITRNVDGTLTGNVFSEEGGTTFIFCMPDDVGGYTCSVAGSCRALPCTEQYVTLDGSFTLPETFFTLPESCANYGSPIAITLPKSFFVADPELMREAARLAIVSNPFRTTNVATDDQLAKDAPINDLIIANRDSATPPAEGETVACPGGGLQRLVNCEDRMVDGRAGSFSTIAFEDCTVGSPSDGFIVQKGTIQMLAAGSPCILATGRDLPTGIEITEFRDNFETTFFNGPGLPTEVDLEIGTGFVTHSNACIGVDLRFRPNVRRDVSLTTRSEISVAPGTSTDSDVILRGYDATIRREYSQDCGTRTTTLDGRRIATSDGRTGEQYAAGFDDLKYALKDGSSFSIDGGLTEGCSGSNRAFTYRTITPATFDRDGDGCPRGGAFELSAEGTVIGQLSFSDAGGVTLTPVAGEPIGITSCNDPQLRLTTCPLD